MQWHWGNIGSAVGGLAAALAALAVVVSVLRRGPDAYRTWKENRLAESDLAREQAEDLRLERHRQLQGWGGPGSLVAAYSVALVTEPAEMSKATDELAGDGPSDYVVLKVTEGPGNPNRARDLRQLIDREKVIARAPTKGEREALEAGLNIIEPAPEPERPNMSAPRRRWIRWDAR